MKIGIILKALGVAIVIRCVDNIWTLGPSGAIVPSLTLIGTVATVLGVSYLIDPLCKKHAGNIQTNEKLASDLIDHIENINRPGIFSALGRRRLAISDIETQFEVLKNSEPAKQIAVLSHKNPAGLTAIDLLVETGHAESLQALDEHICHPPVQQMVQQIADGAPRLSTALIKLVASYCTPPHFDSFYTIDKSKTWLFDAFQKGIEQSTVTTAKDAHRSAARTIEAPKDTQGSAVKRTLAVGDSKETKEGKDAGESKRKSLKQD